MTTTYSQRARIPRWTASAGRTSLSVVIVLALWPLALAAFGVSPYLAKGPLDVWDYLFVSAQAPAHREAIGEALSQTIVDAAIGFVVGLLAAVVMASLFRLAAWLGNAVMPLVTLLSTIPLVALAPLMILLFGRSVALVATLGGLVVLFPALVMMNSGMTSASTQALEVARVYGASRQREFLTVILPSALPAILVAIRISIPSAITGALVAEWLATGRGLGYSIQVAVVEFRITEVWASAAVISIISLALYLVASLIERLVLRSFAFVL